MENTLDDRRQGPGEQARLPLPPDPARRRRRVQRRRVLGPGAAAGQGQPQPGGPAVRRHRSAAVPLGHRAVRHRAGPDGLHQAGHRGARRPRGLLQRQGQITVNGVPLHEKSYLFPGERAVARRTSASSCRPGGCGSWATTGSRAPHDSRGHDAAIPGDGTIPENKVVGRAFMIVWPPSRWRVLPIPATFGQPGLIEPAAPPREPAPRPGARCRPGRAATCRWRPGSPRAVPLTWLRSCAAASGRRQARRRSQARLGWRRRPGGEPAWQGRPVRRRGGPGAAPARSGQPWRQSRATRRGAAAA